MVTSLGTSADSELLLALSSPCSRASCAGLGVFAFCFFFSRMAGLAAFLVGVAGDVAAASSA